MTGLCHLAWHNFPLAGPSPRSSPHETFKSLVAHDPSLLGIHMSQGHQQVQQKRAWCTRPRRLGCLSGFYVHCDPLNTNTSSWNAPLIAQKLGICVAPPIERSLVKWLHIIHPRLLPPPRILDPQLMACSMALVALYTLPRPTDALTLAAAISR